MNKSIRKLLTGVLVCTSLATVGATAYATTGQFYFSIIKGQRGISDVEIKDDNEQLAYITVNGGDVGDSANDYMHMRVRTQGGQFATASVATTIGTYTTPYSVQAGKQGFGYKLYGQLDDMSNDAVGSSFGLWTP